MKTRGFNSDDVHRCCTGKLKVVFRSRKHHNGWFRVDGKKVCRITIPMGHKPLPEKTFVSMATQLLLSRDEMASLVECTITRDAYTQMVRERKPVA